MLKRPSGQKKVPQAMTEEFLEGDDSEQDREVKFLEGDDSKQDRDGRRDDRGRFIASPGYRNRDALGRFCRHGSQPC